MTSDSAVVGSLALSSVVRGSVPADESVVRGFRLVRDGFPAPYGLSLEYGLSLDGTAGTGNAAGSLERRGTLSIGVSAERGVVF